MARIGRTQSTWRAAALAALAVVALQAPSAAAATPTDLLPDLRMETPTQLTLERANGHYWLRFSAMISNVGDGPLEIRSTRRCPTCTHMFVKQAILRSDGTWRSRKTTTRQRYDNSDGHHHWHVMGMERYELFPMDAPFEDGPLTGHKRGFCFFDGYTRDSTLPGYPTTSHYQPQSCGTPSSQSLVVGLSVGWGDLYPFDFAGQYVDLTGVPAGDYLVCLTADASNWFTEIKDGNNAAWAKIHIPAANTIPDNHRTPVTAIAFGQSACKSKLPYDPKANRRSASRIRTSGQGVGGASAGQRAAPSVISQALRPEVSSVGQPRTTTAALPSFVCSLDRGGTTG